MVLCSNLLQKVLLEKPPKIMTFSLVPYVGAAPLIFGMTRDQAIEILGEPRLSIPSSPLPGKSLDFTGMSLAFDENGKLMQIGFDRHFPGRLLFAGVDVLKDENAMTTLVTRDGTPFLWVGFLMLLNLGVRLGGYHDEADEGKTVSLFMKGRYDSKIPRFAPFEPRKASSEKS